MKRAIGQGEARETAYFRPSLMAKSSAVRMEVSAGSLQAVARFLEGTYMAAPTDGGFGSLEPSVYMWKWELYCVCRSALNRFFPSTGQEALDQGVVV